MKTLLLFGSLKKNGDTAALAGAFVRASRGGGADPIRLIFHLSLPGLPVLLEPSRLQHTGRDAGCRPLLEGVR